MAFADWIPTIINVGSSLFGGGGSSAPSAPSSSGLDWGSILQGVGQLASRVEMVPGAGALDEDIRKANRFNLLAGLLGGGAQLAGGQMQASEKAGMLKDVSDILSGKQTTTGQAIDPAFAGTSATPTATPTATPIATPTAQPSTSMALMGLVEKYPKFAKEIFEVSKGVKEAEATARKDQDAAAISLANILTRQSAGNLASSPELLGTMAARVPGVNSKQIVESLRERAEQQSYDAAQLRTSQIERNEASARASEGLVPVREAQAKRIRKETGTIDSEQQRREQSAARSALNTEFNFNNQSIKSLDRQIDQLRSLLPQTDQDQQAIDTAYADLSSQRNALKGRNDALAQQLRDPQQFAPPTAQQGTPITATTQQQAVDALQQVGLSPNEISSYQQGISNLPTTQTITQPFAVQATPTATPSPEATRNPLSGLMGKTTRAAGDEKSLEQAVKREDALAKIAPEYIDYKNKYSSTESAYGELKNAFDSNNPAATNGAITQFIRSLDKSVVQKGDREAFMRGIVTKQDQIKEYANSWLGEGIDLPPEAKRKIENYAKLARDYYKRSEAASQIVANQLVEDRNNKITNTSFNLYWNGDPETGVLDLVTAKKYGLPFGTKIIRRP